MNLKTTATATYAFFVLVGGLIGYLKAGSIASLAMGLFFSALLFSCAFAIYKKSVLGHVLSLALTSFLLLFFGFRFFQKLAFMPAGLMVCLSIGLLSILLFKNYETALSKD
jgi:uncharacterized membrane protein (UPF0136 family)